MKLALISLAIFSLIFITGCANPNMEKLFTTNADTAETDAEKITRLENRVKELEETHNWAKAETEEEIITEVTTTIDLNTATLEQLETLPGIGPVKARRIVQYRKAKKGFKTTAHIKLIGGIGQKTYSDLKNLVSVTPYTEK